MGDNLWKVELTNAPDLCDGYSRKQAIHGVSEHAKTRSDNFFRFVTPRFFMSQGNHRFTKWHVRFACQN